MNKKHSVGPARGIKAPPLQAKPGDERKAPMAPVAAKVPPPLPPLNSLTMIIIIMAICWGWILTIILLLYILYRVI